MRSDCGHRNANGSVPPRHTAINWTGSVCYEKPSDWLFNVPVYSLYEHRRCLLIGLQILSDEVLAWLFCLQRGANDLHVVQLMPLPPITSCFIKIQNGLLFWYRLTQVVLEKRPLNCYCCCCFVLFSFSALDTVVWAMVLGSSESGGT